MNDKVSKKRYFEIKNAADEAIIKHAKKLDDKAQRDILIDELLLEYETDDEKQIFKLAILFDDDIEFITNYNNENKNVSRLAEIYNVAVADVMSKISEIIKYREFIDEYYSDMDETTPSEEAVLEEKEEVMEEVVIPHEKEEKVLAPKVDVDEYLGAKVPPKAKTTSNTADTRNMVEKVNQKINELKAENSELEEEVKSLKKIEDEYLQLREDVKRITSLEDENNTLRAEIERLNNYVEDIFKNVNE